MTALSPRARAIADAAGRWAVEIDAECTVSAAVAAEILAERHGAQFEQLARRWRDVHEAGDAPAEILGYAAANGRWTWEQPAPPSPDPTLPPRPEPARPDEHEPPPDFQLPDTVRARGLEHVAALRARIAEMSNPS